MKKIGGIIGVIVLILLLSSGIFANIVKFFSWLFMVDYMSPNTSFVGGIFVRILTFFASYAIVGLIFNAIGFFDSKIMSLAHLIISILVSFILSYIIMLCEKYWIIFIIAFALLITIYIVIIAFEKKNNKEAK